jgi:hypothetical protein
MELLNVIANFFRGLLQLRTVPYSAFDLIVLALATMYAAHAITSTDGPFFVFLKLRERTRHVLKGLLDCIVCTAFWVALVLLLLYGIAPGFIWVLAVAGAALAVRTYTGVKHG